MCHKIKRRPPIESGTVAKERLRLMIDAGRKQIDEETMTQIRREIGAVVTKYVDVEPENMEVKIILHDYVRRAK